MSEAATFNLPLWAEILVAFFALCGGLVGLLGASGVLRLPTFFARVHAPALITTAGIWCLMLATITYFSVQSGRPALNVLLLGLFIAITAPVTTIFLMRAALFRSRQSGEDVPRSVNMLQLAVPKLAPEKDDDDHDDHGNSHSDDDGGNADDSGHAPDMSAPEPAKPQ
ncbi:monovalent cation/H(+) antiporter subunit G [Vandammella animalimorsus]|uniref:Na+/H+ antiporter subunit G n=1 Tax=Vandammella animalimorsus TaxID=2029117 RepID=A0A2A2AK86_9BURK|nr:Na+/H+ antiporter subunit G [Vandammella animalimorsus]